MKLLKNIAFGLLVCVIFFTLLELFLFAFGLDYRERNIKLQNKYHTIENAPELPPDYQGQIPTTIWHNVIHNELCYPDVEYIFKVRGNPSGDPVLGYEGINAQGFRGNDFEVKTGWKRVMVLGNSCVFGWELLQLESTFPYKLQEKLTEAGQEYQVFNFGQPGYSTTQCLKLYKEWKEKINPDIVILYTGWNDSWPTPLLTDKQTMQALKVNNTWLARQLRKMRTYGLMRKLIKGDSNPQAVQINGSDSNRMRVPLDETAENLNEIITGTKAIIILPPYCRQERDIIEPYRQMVIDNFGEKAAVLRMDSMDISSPNTADYFSADGFHPNAKGTEYIANQLAMEIIGISE